MPSCWSRLWKSDRGSRSGHEEKAKHSARKGKGKEVLVPTAQPSSSGSVPSVSPATKPEDYGLFCLSKEPTVGYDIDVVAVHGLGGHWDKTWSDSNGKNWLRDFLPEEFPNARIMAFGYDSKMFFSSSVTDIEDVACTLLNRLDGERDKRHKNRPIVFIAHSLGGIVVKKAMIIAHERSNVYGELLKSVCGVMFFGVPHRGSDVAYWGDIAVRICKMMFLKANTNFIAPLRRKSATFADISQQFIERGQPPLQIYTFYELEKVKKQILVVDKDSARLGLPNEIVVPLSGADHRDMCRFDNPESQKYQPVRKALQKLVDSATEVHGSSSSSKVLSPEETVLMQNLSTSDYLSHRQRIPTRAPGTCEWFLQHAKYQSWLLESKANLLWLSAYPGCGKSTIASLLVDELKSPTSQASLPGAVCYFFFKDDNEKQKKAISALSAILHQLFTARPALIKHALFEFQVMGERCITDFTCLWRILTKASLDPDCGNVFCIIDALDECEEISRVALINSLTKWHSAASKSIGNHTGLRFIITSRPYRSIERFFFTLPTIRLKAEISSTNADIAVVVKARLQQIAESHGISSAVRSDLEGRLIRNARATFLWVALVLVMIEESARTSQAALHSIVGNIPQNLDAVYEKILSQSRNPTEARKVLHIIVAAREPLNLEEMAIAYSIKSSDKSAKDLDLEPDIASTIKQLCGPIVRVIENKFHLVHQTAKEFLCTAVATASAAQSEGPWKRSLHPFESNRILLDICTRYLSFSEFECDPLGEEQGKKPMFELNIPRLFGSIRNASNHRTQNPFLNYAAVHWPWHARNTNIRDDRKLMESVLDLCNTVTKPRPWVDIYYCTRQLQRPLVFLRMLNINIEQPTAFLVATALGLWEIVQVLLPHDINQTWPGPTNMSLGSMALSVAVAFGHHKVARVLLENGAKVNGSWSHPLLAFVLAWDGTDQDLAWLRSFDEAESYKEILARSYGKATHEPAPMIRLLVESGADVKEALQNLEQVRDWCYSLRRQEIMKDQSHEQEP